MNPDFFQKNCALIRDAYLNVCVLKRETTVVVQVQGSGFRVCSKNIKTHELLFLHECRYCGHFLCLPLWGTYYTIARGGHTKGSPGSQLLTQVRCKWEPKVQYSVLSRLGALFSFLLPVQFLPFRCNFETSEKIIYLFKDAINVRQGIILLPCGQFQTPLNNPSIVLGQHILRLSDGPGSL